MKKALIFIPVFVWFLSLCAYSQIKKVKDANLPQILPEAFNQKFFKIKPYAWYFDPQNNIYIAHYNKKTTEFEAFFTPDGLWQSTETVIDKMTVPAIIQDEFNKSEYKDWNIVEIRRLESLEMKDCCKYKVKKGKDVFIIFYDKEGKLIKKEKA